MPKHANKWKRQRKYYEKNWKENLQWNESQKHNLNTRWSSWNKLLKMSNGKLGDGSMKKQVKHILKTSTIDKKKAPNISDFNVNFLHPSSKSIWLCFNTDYMVILASKKVRLVKQCLLSVFKCALRYSKRKCANQLCGKYFYYEWIVVQNCIDEGDDHDTKSE